MARILIIDDDVTLRQALTKHLELSGHEVRQAADGGEPAYRVRRMFAPPKGGGAEMLNGSPSDVAARIAELIRERLS